MRKFILGLVLGILLMIPLSGSAEMPQFYLSPHSLYVDGIKIKDSMYMKDGANYIPLRSVSEVLGAQVDYLNGRVDITMPLTDLEEVAKKCKDSCIMIHTFVEGKGKAQGSGFVYGDYVITAKHVIKDSRVIYIFTDDNVVGRRALVMPLDTNLDVIALKVKTFMPSVELGNADKLKEGEEVVSITSPHGVMNAIERCIFSGTDKFGGGHMLRLSENSMGRGSSGGAVFNYNGEIIGMVVAGEGSTYQAIPINDIIPLLDQLK